MKHLAKMALASLTLSALALADEADSASRADSIHAKKDDNHYGYIGAGMAMPDIEKLNDRSQQWGLDEFGETPFMLSFGHEKLHERFVGGSNMSLLIWRNQYAQNIKSTMLGGYWIASGGINVLPASASEARLYPEIGFGPGYFFQWNRPHKREFDAAPAAPANQDPLWAPAFIFTFGAGANYIIKIPNEKESIGVGIKVGYMLDVVKKDDWHQNGTKLTGGPDSRLTGFYVKATIGGVGKKSDLHDDDCWKSRRSHKRRKNKTQ
ncbi:MAG: hypothetical protein GF398_02945 [Chitinivibrionales bacterium]|nr:hypothetical protein [Chitinivibrionales bacterium]